MRSDRTSCEEGGDGLAITISLVVLLGVIVWALHRYAGLKLVHAIVCVFFGFFLAATSAAPTIRNAVSGVIGYFTGHH